MHLNHIMKENYMGFIDIIAFRIHKILKINISKVLDITKNNSE